MRILFTLLFLALTSSLIAQIGAVHQGISIPGRYTFGNSESAIELGVQSGDYNAIRGYNNSQSIGAIHFFDDTWGSSLPSNSAGTINIDALKGVTIGPWNNPSAYIRNSDGYFGIGVEEPTSRLHVLDGGIRHGGTGEINIDANGLIGGRFKILDNGNIGVGTDTPNSKLDIFGNSGNTTNLILSANYKDSYRWRLKTEYRGYAIDLDFTVSDSDDTEETLLKLSRSTSNRPEFQFLNNALVINNGIVGMGTETPISNSRLDVIGGIAVAGQRALDSDATKIWVGDLAGGDGLRKLILRAGDQDRLWINEDGKVGIGTSSMGNHKLAVEGTIGARAIKVEASGWSDFVFNDDYKLRSLEETEQFIEQNNHLPEIPTEAEVIEDGINLGEMDAKLLQKIEELTLHLIEVNKMVKSQISRIDLLEAQNKILINQVKN